MPLLFDWFIPQQVIYIRFPAVTGYSFFANVNREIVEYMDASPHPLHIFADARFVQRAPTNPLKLRSFSYAFDHDKIGHALLVSENALYRLLGATVPRIVSRTKTVAFHTVEEGLDFMRQKITPLDWDTAVYTVFDIAQDLSGQ